MSSSISPSPESFDCTACTESFQVGHAVHGSYCSLECYYREKGERVLRHIEQDHRWCATCFRQVKDVEPPSQQLLDALEPETSKAVIGQQFQTETTVWAVDARDGANPMHPIEHQRWGCECGTVDPSTLSKVLQHVDTQQTIVSLWACLQELWSEDQLASQPARAEFFAGLRESDFDWAVAVGRAIHS